MVANVVAIHAFDSHISNPVLLAAPDNGLRCRKRAGKSIIASIRAKEQIEVIERKDWNAAQ